MKTFLDESPWAELTYHCHANIKDDTHLPLTPVTSQRSWRDCLEARVRMALRALLPEDRAVIEGVLVRRYTSLKDNSGKLYYAVESVKADSLEDAVSKVIQHIQGGK